MGLHLSRQPMVDILMLDLSWGQVPLILTTCEWLNCLFKLCIIFTYNVIATPAKNRICVQNYDFYSSISERSSSDSSSSSSDSQRQGLLGLLQLSSAIHIQASVQASPLLLQEQFFEHFDVVEHLQLVSSKILLGAAGFVISTGQSSLSSNFHPQPTGEGRSCLATSARLHTQDWKFALAMCCFRLSDVGGSSRLFFVF